MMNRWLFLVCWISLASIFLAMIQPGTQIRVNSLVIDAGHGGKDPGARSKYGIEKEFALDMALRLGKKIKKDYPDVKVIFTRDNDTFIPLHERAAIANRNKASLFISIHCNANPHSSKLRGTESYVMGLHKSNDNLELAKRENNVVLLEENYKKTYKGFDPNSPLAHIMLANYQSSFRQQSLHIASLIEQKIKKTGYPSRGVKQAGFLVIWETTMPSVLFEAGYLTNDQDGAYLATSRGREEISQSLFEAFRVYKNEMEGTSTK